VEMLRKVMSEMEEVLSQTANALEFMEEKHRAEMKKVQEEKDLEEGMLNLRIRELEAVS
jgi:hypothetical protein